MFAATIACRAERRQFVICFSADLPLWGQCASIKSGDYSLLTAPLVGTKAIK
jgi:hypothetical protein